MASFPTILFRDLKGVSWYGTCGSQKNWQMDMEDVNDLLIHPRAFTNLTNHSNQQYGGVFYKPPSRLAALSTVLRAIAKPPHRRVRYAV